MAIIYERSAAGWSWSVHGWPERTHCATLEQAVTGSTVWLEQTLGAIKRAHVPNPTHFTRTQLGWVSSLAVAREAATLGRAVVEVFGEPASMTIAMEGDSNGPKRQDRSDSS